jgi:heat shock protein HtpX
VTPLFDYASRSDSDLAQNRLQSLLLIGGLGGLGAVCGWLLSGPIGAAAVLVAAGVLYASTPRLPAAVVMRMYRAQPLDPRQGGQIVHIVALLARRAGLASPPSVHVIASMTLNAFTSGSREQAAIAVTEGLLRRLSLRELAGVLAHEIAHVRNNDLAVMGLADAMTRITQVLCYLALLLFIINLPELVLGDSDVSLTALALLYLAPSLGSMLQLALSRTREYAADAAGAMLTGDPAGLASALERMQPYRGSFAEDLMLPVPGRRIPQPSLLRSHPPSAERIRRLMALEHRELPPPIEIVEEPMTSMVGFGPGSLQPRYRFPGVWF